jgi:hypothetical protein
MTINIFEQATRQGLRFNTRMGKVTVEDLWQLSLNSTKVDSLESIAVAIYTEQQAAPTVSFVGAGSAASAVLTLKLDILKRIIEVRQAENAAKTNEVADRQHNERIDELIQKQKDRELEGKSIDELVALRR